MQISLSDVKPYIWLLAIFLVQALYLNYFKSVKGEVKKTFESLGP